MMCRRADVCLDQESDDWLAKEITEKIITEHYLTKLPFGFSETGNFQPQLNPPFVYPKVSLFIL